MSDTILIKGGRVVDPASGLDRTADVLVRDGKVEAIETTPGRVSADATTRTVDAEGLIVAPGLMDIHVHLREPSAGRHLETIATGVASAVSGGFTTVCCMPNTTPPLDGPAPVKVVQETAAALRMARVFVVAAATVDRAGESMTAIDALARAGAVGFTDDGDVIADASMMRRVLAAARAADRCVMQHCQEPSLTRDASMNAGALAMRMGLTGWPAVAEELIVERDIRINRSIGARYHAQHVSGGASVEMIRAARAEGLPVSGEASPHHLLLTEDACAGYETNAKMNPPLRTAADRAALREGVADGTITVLATDHAPHPPETKMQPFATASFGIVGLDCALPLYVRALIDEGVLDWPQMLALMTINPARLVGLDRLGLGTLAAGGPADVTLIDPALEWTIRAADFASTGRNCPFDGWTVRGKTVGTIVAGRPLGGLAEPDGDRSRSVPHLHRGRI